MDDFVFYNPTKILFGRGTENRVGAEARNYGTKVLIHYGGNFIQGSAFYARIRESLESAGLESIELAGVLPNPRLSLVREGIKLCREKGIGLVLAIGGGSTIDSAKAIGIGVPYDGDVWDFFTGTAVATGSLPVGVILTIPATGSEASNGSVITNEQGWLKRAAMADAIYPRFSILNPELAFSLPPYQVACGIADICSHLLERYFTNSVGVNLTDQLIEGALRAVIRAAPTVLSHPTDYDSWAEIMWSGTIAHNGLLNTGRVGDWASHDIEHELSGIYDVAHGAGMAVVFPAWMKYVKNHDILRFAQLASRVWGIEQSLRDPEHDALEGIARFEAFWSSLGLSTRLPGIGIEAERIDEMAAKCTRNGTSKIGNFVALSKGDVVAILRLAC
ncbi:MAG: iron-containing alcohol dehydrogenase [Rectinemataceae bacterium]|jgi:hypothetical protein